jgi:hypothetical protein
MVETDKRTIIFQLITERRGSVVNTPAAYSTDPCSDLDVVTGYPDRGFSWFLSALPIP